MDAGTRPRCLHAYARRCSMTADPNPTVTSTPSLNERERFLALKLSSARAALWREWAECGSQEARDAFYASDPADCP